METDCRIRECSYKLGELGEWEALGKEERFQKAQVLEDQRRV